MRVGLIPFYGMENWRDRLPTNGFWKFNQFGVYIVGFVLLSTCTWLALTLGDSISRWWINA
jgi:hypothetical protein